MITLKIKKIAKWILMRVLILSAFLILFVTCTLRMVDIEDRYGDLQSIYWESEDGDIVFNKLNSTSAIIEKDWHRMYVKVDGKLIPVDKWVDPNNEFNFNVELYRTNGNLKSANNLNRTEIEKGIRNSSLEFITKLNVKY